MLRRSDGFGGRRATSQPARLRQVPYPATTYLRSARGDADGADVDVSTGVVQLTVRLVAAPERLADIVRTLHRVVMRPTQQLAGCQFAQVYLRMDEPLRVDYVEEWDDAESLRPHLSGERFGRLLELLEMATEAPEVSFRCITETHGIEYVATQRAVQASKHDA